MKILAVDPGVTTGYCYAEISSSGKLRFHPFQVVDDVDECWRRLEEFKPRYIICESFEFRNAPRQRSGTNLFPVQIIGVVRLYELTSPGGQCSVYMQTPATGKGYYTDNVLKQLGLYKRGVPHGTDASRHLLQWCTFGMGYQFIDKNDREYATRLDSWTHKNET